MLSIFNSFKGKWNINRNILHKLELSPPSSTSTSSNINSNQNNSCSINNNNRIFRNDDSNSIPIQRVTVTGIATFIPIQEDDPLTLKYMEEGVLEQDDGNRFNVTQSYIYKYEASNDKISVYFNEQPIRLLHSLDTIENNNIDNHQNITSSSTTTTVVTGHHLCGSDTYDALYTFINPQEFKLTYKVKGPQKNYEMTTQFKKMV